MEKMKLVVPDHSIARVRLMVGTIDGRGIYIKGQAQSIVIENASRQQVWEIVITALKEACASK